MIQVYDIISRAHDSNSAIQFKMSNISTTWGNQFKMHLTQIHYNTRKQFFSNIIIAVWNSWPNKVIPQILLTYLRIIWISFGLIRILNLPVMPT